MNTCFCQLNMAVNRMRHSFLCNRLLISNHILQILTTCSIKTAYVLLPALEVKITVYICKILPGGHGMACSLQIHV